ncbi:hypothetical protein NJB1604_27160 [Mycobacterium marinum]|nr:hypothetical protein NJB1604_27160 [Mycobacterium marinum]
MSQIRSSAPSDMTFEWTPELQLQAAQNALAYVSIVQFSRATNDAAGRDAVLTSVLNDFTDAGVSEEDAMSQLFSGLTTVANLAVEVGARRSGVSPQAILEEMGALLAQVG